MWLIWAMVTIWCGIISFFLFLNSILVIVNKWGVTLIENSQVGFHWLAIMRPDWSIHANWGFSMVDRQSNWSLISAVRHIWAPYHHDQCWVSLLPTAPGGVPSGGMEVLMMWWHSFLPSLTLSGLRRPKEIKLQNIDDPTIPNKKYRDGNKYKIQITGLATNTNYRAGNKYKMQSWQQNRTGSITIPWPCSLPSWAACGVPLTLLPKQSAQSILQFTSTFVEKKDYLNQKWKQKWYNWLSYHVLLS